MSGKRSTARDTLPGGRLFPFLVLADAVLELDRAPSPSIIFPVNKSRSAPKLRARGRLRVELSPTKHRHAIVPKDNPLRTKVE